MKIDFNVTDILPLRWTELTRKALNENIFDNATFISLFEETFEIIRYCVCEEHVDKEMFDLIRGVSGFVTTKFVKLNNEHLAACELTDAMIFNCFQPGQQDAPITTGTWFYAAEMKIDFSDVENALNKIATEIEEWDLV